MCSSLLLVLFVTNFLLFGNCLSYNAIVVHAYYLNKERWWTFDMSCKIWLLRARLSLGHGKCFKSLPVVREIQCSKKKNYNWLLPSYICIFHEHLVNTVLLDAQLCNIHVHDRANDKSRATLPAYPGTM